MIGARAVLLALVLALAAGARAEDPLPVWPHEQQALLRETESELLAVQRQLYKARRQGDAAAEQTHGEAFRTLQLKRRALIELTKDQLPVE